MPEVMSARDGGVSRRRVLIGAAWAAPAIVIAASSPALAASGVPGILVNNTLYASVRTDLGFVIYGELGYRHDGPYGGGPNPSGAPITGIYSDFSFPQSIYLGPPTVVSGAGWIVTDLGNVGGTRTIRYSYGGTLTAPNDTSVKLTFSIPVKSSNYSGQTLTVNTVGTSAATTVGPGAWNQVL